MDSIDARASRLLDRLEERDISDKEVDSIMKKLEFLHALGVQLT